MNYLQLQPLDIRYTQDSISREFRNGQLIGELLDDLVDGVVQVRDIPKITVSKIRRKFYSHNNRRLWVMQQLQKLGKCSKITVKLVPEMPSHNFTAKNGGKEIRIRGGDPGGWSYNQLVDDDDDTDGDYGDEDYSDTDSFPSGVLNNTRVYNTSTHSRAFPVFHHENQNNQLNRNTHSYDFHSSAARWESFLDQLAKPTAFAADSRGFLQPPQTPSVVETYVRDDFMDSSISLSKGRSTPVSPSPVMKPTAAQSATSSSPSKRTQETQRSGFLGLLDSVIRFFRDS